ncbi:hypothetical protein [Bacteroides sp. 51]|uniref:hypothetical protein n=1 Tax=Bacteroides sp. 51 TaxID=2302938 RepID=UPI0013D4E69B|nr:hypothetical protein [Bacteroides sp. 51]NDV80776.1 hypothetical protein [Bacteroides sp. 51]
MTEKKIITQIESLKDVDGIFTLSEIKYVFEYICFFRCPKDKRVEYINDLLLNRMDLYEMIVDMRDGICMIDEGLFEESLTQLRAAFVSMIDKFAEYFAIPGTTPYYKNL